MWNDVITPIFWTSLLCLFFSLALLAWLYKCSITRLRLLLYGFLLILASATMLKGFGYTAERIDFWFNHVQNGEEVDKLIWLRLAVFYIQYIIPLSIAAVGAILFTKAIENGIVIKTNQSIDSRKDVGK